MNALKNLCFLEESQSVEVTGNKIIDRELVCGNCLEIRNQKDLSHCLCGAALL